MLLPPSVGDMGNSFKCTLYYKETDLGQGGIRAISWLLMDKKENPFSINDAFLVINPNDHGWLDWRPLTMSMPSNDFLR